jgi:NAD/NADP transhydrogenase beta subunit
MWGNLLEIIYLVASVTFIIGLKMMGNPKTARRGNTIGAVGMTIAIIGTIFFYQTDFERNASRVSRPAPASFPPTSVA